MGIEALKARISGRLATVVLMAVPGMPILAPTRASSLHAAA